MLSAEEGRLLAGGKEIEGDRVVQFAVEAELLLAQRIEGQEIGLRVGGKLFIDRAVHVDGEGGDDDVLAAFKEFGNEPAFLLAHDAAGDGQRAVEKGIEDAPAVGFDVQPREGAVRKGGVFLELEGGGVGVRGDDPKGAFGRLISDAEGDERAVIALHIVRFAALRVPFLVLGKGGKAVCGEHGGGVMHGMKGRGGAVEEIYKRFKRGSIHRRFLFVVFLHYTTSFPKCKREVWILKIPKRENVCGTRMKNSEIGKYIDKVAIRCYTAIKRRRNAA